MGKVFDWDKAARIIKESGCTDADAGLLEDWFWTAGTIFADGEPDRSGYCYLASYWATPAIQIGDVYHQCYKQEEEAPEWDEHTVWPESALKILNGEENNAP